MSICQLKRMSSAKMKEAKRMYKAHRSGAFPERLIEVKREYREACAQFAKEQSEILHLEFERNEKRKEKTKEYQAKFRERRKCDSLYVLSGKVQRFQKRGECSIPFSPQHVIAKFGAFPKCHLTGLPVNYADAATYQLDHIVPISLGGQSNLDNLELCHPMANQMKNGYSLDEFVRFCHLIAERHPKKTDPV